MEKKRIAGALLALGLGACGGGGGGGGPQNAVTLLSAACPGGAGSLPATTCIYLEVETQGNPPIDVELRITEPSAPYVGTAVVASGEGGDEFYANIPGGEEMIRDLGDVGLRVVDRRWSVGWLSSSFEAKQQSARLAELLEWIRANEHQEPGLFFAIGNSGGSAEIAYSLTAWGHEDLFDGVVLASGPSFSRLDYLCLPPTPEWSAHCQALIASIPPLECGAPPCSATTESFCQSVPPTSSATELEADSILYPGADLDFGALPVHVIIGANDCSGWVPQGLLFHESVLSAKTLQTVPGTGHTVPETPQGRDAILQAVLGFAPSAAPAGRGQVGIALTLIEDGETAAAVSATAPLR